MLVGVSLCLIFSPGLVRRVHAASYVETAVAAHRSYLEGSLAPDIQSDSAAFVTAWFAGKVPFDFRLPAARGGNPVYRLAGAKLVNYREQHAALVIYETPREKISLLVASNKCAAIGGGDEVRAGSLVFHLEQSWSLLRSRVLNISLGARVLSRLPSEHGGPRCVSDAAVKRVRNEQSEVGQRIPGYPAGRNMK
jgi:hypothetical protein